MTHPLLPDLPGFSIEQVPIADGVILVLAQSQTTRSSCPDCAHLSSRIHSRYQRKLADLPWSGRIVRLVVQVCRFFCKHPSCPRKTFAEPIPAVASRYARRTTRLKEVLEHLGLALGGELDFPWSQGQTEGQITRLKLIKRQGYGRAKFDLLRQRVLHAA